MSNQFEADRGWLEEKIDMVMNIIGADQDTYQRLQGMLTEAKTHNKV